MIPDARCTECSWSGDFADLETDESHLLGCPECYAPTKDTQGEDDDDTGDERGD